MHPPTARVVHEHRPYLVQLDEVGRLVRAFGPFTPGTEPSLDACDHETEVSDPAILVALAALLPVSPRVPDSKDRLG